MSDLLSTLIKTHGMDIAANLAKQVKIEPATAATLLPQAAPLVLAAIQRTLSDPQAQQSVMGVAEQLMGSGNLDDIAGLVGSSLGKSTGPAGVLTDLIAGHLKPAAAGVAEASGLTKTKAQSAMIALAPVVLGYLINTQGKNGLSLDGLKLLVDKNGDGQILDDVMGFITTQATQPGGGIFGTLLGALTTKR